jgi:hypothetical protein
MADPGETLGSPWSPLVIRPGSSFVLLQSFCLALSSDRMTVTFLSSYRFKKRVKLNGVWQGVAMDSLKFHQGPPCPYPSKPCEWATPERPFGLLRGGPIARRAACGRLLPHWTPHAVRLCVKAFLKNDRF